MNTFISNRLCFKIAYPDKSRSPYFLLKKLTIIDISIITVFLLTPWKLAEEIAKSYCKARMEISLCLLLFKKAVLYLFNDFQV